MEIQNIFEDENNVIHNMKGLSILDNPSIDSFVPGNLYIIDTTWWLNNENRKSCVEIPAYTPFMFLYKNDYDMYFLYKEEILWFKIDGISFTIRNSRRTRFWTCNE